MIYLALFLCFLIQFFVFDVFKQKAGKAFWWKIDLLFLIALAGFRWQVGGDSFSYQDAFENDISTLGSFFSTDLFTRGWEPGFLFLMSLCKTIYNEFWLFQLLHAIIVNIILLNFLKKYTNLHFLSLLIYLIFNYLYLNTEVLREALAVCVFIYMFEALKVGNLKKYYFLNILAIFFHYSSLLLLLFPLLVNFRLSFRNLMIVVLAVISTSLFLPVIQNILSLLPFGERLISKMDIYLMYNLNINGTIYKILCFVVYPLLVIKATKRFPEIFSGIRILYIPFLFVAIVYVMYSGFGRFLNYFIPFMMVGISQCIYMLIEYKWFSKVKILFIILVLLPPFYYKSSYYLRSTSDLYPNTVVFNRWYPYSSIFTEETYEFRRVLYIEGMRETQNRVQDN